jgi:hypothetical protein
MIKSGCTCTGLFVYGYRGFFCSAESSARDSAGKSFPRRLFPRSVSRIGTQHVNKATRGRCGNGNGSPFLRSVSRIGTQHVNKAARGRCGNRNESSVKQISRTPQSPLRETPRRN